ncbi:autophagy modulator [Desmophyllum pertusum]|uniref:Autophagy modulator n=1 Tax=Desmophyllum pertusum TaxID=174260 RepID=A0A9W9YP80_9CNID|nr:autophagy modulator [Desmophyllum pertusum]
MQKEFTVTEGPAMITLSRSIHLSPVLWPLLICITIFTPYIIAVSLNHVSPFLPSISKSAAFEPEGSIFGILMTLVAFYGLMMMFSRYLQLDAAVQGDLKGVLQKVAKLNKVALPFGVSCLLGVVVVGNFQSSLHEESLVMGKVKKGSSLGKIHDAGTAFLLVCGILYYWLQTAISYHTVKVGFNSKCVFTYRLVLSGIMTFTGVGYPFFKWFSYTKFNGSVEYWSPGDGGYILHVVNCAGEWVACLSLALYAVSFYKEFQNFLR